MGRKRANVPKRTVNTRNKKAEAIETTQNVEPDPVPAPEPVPEPTNTKSTKESPKSKNLAKVTPPVVRKTRRSARFAEIVPDPPPKEDIESAVDATEIGESSVSQESEMIETIQIEDIEESNSVGLSNIKLVAEAPDLNEEISVEVIIECDEKASDSPDNSNSHEEIVVVNISEDPSKKEFEDTVKIEIPESQNMEVDQSQESINNEKLENVEVKLANIVLEDQVKVEEMDVSEVKSEENLKQENFDSKDSVEIPSEISMDLKTEESKEILEITKSEVIVEVKPDIDEDSQESNSRVRRSRRLKSIVDRFAMPDPSLFMSNSSKNANSQPCSALSQESSPVTSLTNSPMASPGDLKVKTRWRKTAEMQDLTINPENENHSDSQFMPSDQLDERLSKFATIPENIYLSERVVCKINKTMKCDCTLSEEEIRAGQLGCRSNCINRLLYIECSPKCRLGVYCDNQQFQKKQYAECDVFRTEKKGFGILAKQEIYPDQFIIEYVGEVLNNNQFDKRAKLYSQEQNKHYYFMALRSNAIIDATIKGNISRFINHSCDPNAMTQKWTVNGELRVGFFSTRFIKPGEEITFDYQFQRYGKKAQKCYCEAENCRGWIGEQPVSDEEEDECESEEGESEEGDDEREEEIPEQEKTPESQKLDKPEKKKKARAGRKKKVVLSKPIVESQDQSSDDEADIDDSKEVEPSQEDIKMPIKKRESTRKYAKKLKKRQEMFDDLEIEEEIKELLRTGLKNRAHTVTFSRLVVRAKNLEARFQLLEILITGDLACQRLFLDYNGLKLFYNYWMSDINKNSVHELKFCIKLLEVLEILPIKNKTVLRDSKVLMMVEKWQNIDLEEKKKKSKEEKKQEKLKKKMKAANPDASMESNPEALPDANLELQDLVKTDVPDEVTCLKMALKEMADQILKKWEVLVEDFKIPKKQKLEEMKLHEKEADLHYQATERDSDRKDDRFKSRNKDAKVTESKSFYRKVPPIVPPNDPLSKHQRRQMFEIQMAQKDAEKRVLEMWAIHEQNCAIFGLNPQMVAPSDIPVYMNSVTGQYYTLDNRPLPTPPNHPRFNISIPPLPQSPEHYDMPKIDLPEHWKYAIDEKGRIYYYHVKIREPQWEPPIKLAPLSKDEDDDGDSDESTTDTVDSEEEELQEILKLLQRKRANKELAAKAAASIRIIGNINNEPEEDDLEKQIMNNMLTNPAEQATQSILSTLNLSASINASPIVTKKKKKSRRGLASAKFIKPRTEEDKLYGIQEMKRYKEIKEKLRREKKRRMLKGLPPPDDDDEDELNDSGLTDSSVDIDDTIISNKFMTSSIDELDLLNKRQQEKLRRSKKSDVAGKSQEKRRSSDFVIPQKKKNKNEPTDQNSTGVDARELKQTFRDEIRADIGKYLLPYLEESCQVGRIMKEEHYQHLINKLTYSVLVKESKHCENTNNLLKATDSVKGKTREYIKKYMLKFGPVYEKNDDQDYSSILNKI